MLIAIGVTGHFISYTFIVVSIRDVVGVRGPNLALLLAALGIAGLISMGVMVRPLDRPQAEGPAGASGLYVTAFQVGIMAGALSGGLFYEDAGVG